jgi:hypothetical protein
MSLADDAKLLLIPTGFGPSKVYSVFPTDGDGDFDYTRSGDASRVNPGGLIETVGTNIPRIDHFGGGCPTLLLQPQRSNFFTYSENSSQWVSSRGITISNNIVAPNGELAGSLYEKTQDANEGFVYRNLSVSSVGTYSVSVFLKYNNSQYAHFLLFDGSSNGARVWFDIENGLVGTTTTFGSTFTASDLSIENYGNGWYRCSAKYVVTGTDTTWRFRVSPSGGNGVTISDSGAKVYFFGAQVEQGSYPTSYIKTETSTVTRLKDECINGGDSDLFDITEGTFFVDITPFNNESSNRYISLSDSTSDNRIEFQIRASANVIDVLCEGNNEGLEVIRTISITFNTRNKLLVTFNDTNFKIYINGSLNFTDTSFTKPINLNRLSFANSTNGFVYEGKVHDTRVYDRVLTEAEAIEITTL